MIRDLETSSMGTYLWDVYLYNLSSDYMCPKHMKQSTE